MEFENRVLARDEICLMLLKAMREKSLLPPAGWSASKSGEEVFKAGGEYETDLLLRQRSALESALFYLVDFAARMPERVNLTGSNGRVKKMCEELASEIEKITRFPGEVIARDGKLKVRLISILAVQTCLIYREETERYIARQDEEKRLSYSAQATGDTPYAPKADQVKPKSASAKNFRQKATPSKSEDSSAQLSLF